MLNILIVDDETPIRRWMASCIHKSDKNHILIGEASNGREALELYTQLKPDVVITDVAMPVMDGLEFIQRLREYDREANVVILTCHEDFHFVRHALKHGATDYLLKTEMREKEVVILLKKIEDEITKKKYEKHAANMMKNNETMEFLQNLYLDDTLLTDGLWRDQARKLELVTGEINFFSIAIRKRNESVCNIDFKLLFHREELLGSQVVYFDERIVVVFGNLVGTRSQLIQWNNLKKLASEIHRETNLSLGLSNVYQGNQWMPTVLRESISALNHAFYQIKPGIEYYVSLDPQKKSSRERIDKIYKSFSHELEGKRYEQAHNISMEFLDEMEKTREQDLNYVEILLSSMLQAYANCDPNNGITTNHKLPEVYSFHELKAYIQKQINVIHKSLIQEGYSASVSETINYISHHYNEPVTLKDIANLVHLSPEYFSRLFKQETGENFSNYLMNYRLGKAENLLANKAYKMYEVAEQVGYPNVSYFSRIYKQFKQNK